MKFLTVVALLIGATVFLLLPGDSEGKKGPLVTDVVSLCFYVLCVSSEKYYLAISYSKT